MALENGLLRHLISDAYTPESLLRIKQVLAEYRTHAIEPVAHGLFAASSSQAVDSVTGYQNVWVRDNVMVADSLRRRGHVAEAVACMQGLTQFFATQLPRFREIIDDPVHVLREDASRRPHIRFTAQTLAELPETWPQAQNDALGHALWFRFVLANSGALPMTTEDLEIYGVFPRYFEAIEYWRDRDSGAWEEGRKINNSSVGAVVAGLEEMLKQEERAASGKSRTEKLAALVAKGRERLESTLPFESPPERLVDSALLFLVHPLNVIRTRAMQDAILNLVQARLKGDVGIKRYAGDSYFCQDYDEWFTPSQMSADFSERLDFRDAHLQPNCEAQWCIFDPLLSIVYGQRFLEDRSDHGSFAKQVHYFNRSLAQVTAAGACPELYFLKHGSYIANGNTPLAWTQANQALALYLMEQSVGENR
ncbi:MAG TPA: glycoside hydrolase family 15 protein [Candidatus Sulfotelmatobacter sp.]|nr:glycoside hydrolase family 15 protein [Candidatus Sulfotelmatobacter sp.]